MSYADAVKKGKNVTSAISQKQNLNILSLYASRPVGGSIYLGPLHSNCDDCESCDTCDYRRGCTDPRCVNGVAQVYDEYVSVEQLEEVEAMRKQAEDSLRATWKREEHTREARKELVELMEKADKFIAKYE